MIPIFFLWPQKSSHWTEFKLNNKLKSFSVSFEKYFFEVIICLGNDEGRNLETRVSFFFKLFFYLFFFLSFELKSLKLVTKQYTAVANTAGRFLLCKRTSWKRGHVCQEISLVIDRWAISIGNCWELEGNWLPWRNNLPWCLFCCRSICLHLVNEQRSFEAKV